MYLYRLSNSMPPKAIWNRKYKIAGKGLRDIFQPGQKPQNRKNGGEEYVSNGKYVVRNWTLNRYSKGVLARSERNNLCRIMIFFFSCAKQRKTTKKTPKAIIFLGFLRSKQRDSQKIRKAPEFNVAAPGRRNLYSSSHHEKPCTVGPHPQHHRYHHRWGGPMSDRLS